MIQGIHVDRVTSWIAENVGGVTPPLTFDLIAGGRSNLTFRVTDALGRALVLRRPPISHLLDTAHDMERECRIISALDDSEVPVPRALALCADPAINERPFYVMDFVQGQVVATAAAADALDVAARGAASANLVDVLARLHAVDVDAVGLGDLGRRADYVARQLRRWHRQFQDSQRQEREAGVFRAADLVSEVHDKLLKRIPAQQAVALVHGDFRLENTIVSASGDVRAVLDWELCTLGDPLADLGILLAYWFQPDDAETLAKRLAVTALPGFSTREVLTNVYARGTELDLSALPFYVAFAHWKLACILEGVFVRFATGAMSVEDPHANLLADMVLERAQLAHAILIKESW